MNSDWLRLAIWPTLFPFGVCRPDADPSAAARALEARALSFGMYWCVCGGAIQLSRRMPSEHSSGCSFACLLFLRRRTVLVDVAVPVAVKGRDWGTTTPPVNKASRRRSNNHDFLIEKAGIR